MWRIITIHLSKAVISSRLRGRRPQAIRSILTARTSGGGEGEHYRPGADQILSAYDRGIVAVIDDDLGMRVSLARLLGAFGCYAETFVSAQAFLDAAAKSKARCLVVDIQLGDISGIELVRQLTVKGFKYPVIFITARDDEEVRRQAEAAGCVALLTKPFAAKLLIDAIVLATGSSIEYPARDALRRCVS